MSWYSSDVIGPSPQSGYGKQKLLCDKSKEISPDFPLCQFGPISKPGKNDSYSLVSFLIISVIF